MKKLEIKFVRLYALNTIFLIDGKEIKRKKNANGGYIYSYETDKDEVEIKIFTIHELSGKYWYIPTLLFFVISFFGILNPQYDKKGKTINFTGKINLSNEENKLSISQNMFKNNETAFIFKGDCEVIDNGTNVYYIDDLILKRLKKFKKIKVIIWLLSLIILFIMMII